METRKRLRRTALAGMLAAIALGGCDVVSTSDSTVPAVDATPVESTGTPVESPSTPTVEATPITPDPTDRGAPDRTIPEFDNPDAAGA